VEEQIQRKPDTVRKRGEKRNRRSGREREKFPEKGGGVGDCVKGVVWGGGVNWQKGEPKPSCW